ncbi:UBP42 hydrolase, partial [Spelaeornis formosus]|nr:UBP42 hydrolase [Elachura formosa]
VIGKGMTPPQKIPLAPEKICMDWQQKRRPGAGLYNLGSTCYLNVILQCLTYTPPLANYLLSRHHSQFCCRQGFCMMCVMEAHVRKVLCSSASAIRPKAVIRVLKCKQLQVLQQDFFSSLIGELLTPFLVLGEFKPDVPGDAYEFLCCTLNAMQTACLSGSSKKSHKHKLTPSINFPQHFYFLPVTCLRCKTVNDIFKTFWDILLKIKGASSLTTALEDFVRPKEMDGQISLCLGSRCMKEVAVTEMVTVHQAPRVLAVCLGRAEDGTNRKLSQVVEYPEHLDLRPYMSDPAGESVLYSLYAVVVHTGHTCLGGHFFCYIKASDGQWYKMNDVSVDSCDIHTVLGQQAYLLFYAR